MNALGNPINSSGAENGSGWQGNVYNGIIPNSVWTTKHRPKCDDPSGMVYLGNGLWGDIYLSSDNGSQGLQSKYNANPITGTEGLNWYIANEKARRGILPGSSRIPGRSGRKQHLRMERNRKHRTPENGICCERHFGA